MKNLRGKMSCMRRAGSYLLLASLAALWSACGTEPEAAKSCRELGQALRQEVGGDAPAYRVLSPNGGESFTVGKPFTVKAIAADNEADALIEFRVVQANGRTQTAIWPGQDQGLNLQDQCELTLTLPDSVGLGANRFSLISEKVSIRVRNYSLAQYADTSDAPFHIRAP